MPTFDRGILVDYQGFFLGALQWDASGPPPNFNVPRRGQRRVLPADVKHLLTSAAALDDPKPNGRWDFNAEVWLLPSVEVWLIAETGALRGRRTIWPTRYVPPIGLSTVSVAPPATVSRRPIWDADQSAWVLPTTVALIDDDEIVQNTVLENPRADQPNVDVPNGWRRIDDSAGPLPSDVDGRGLSRGMMAALDGQWHDIDIYVRKSRIVTVLTNRNLMTQFQTYMEQEAGRWEAFQAAADDDKFDVISPLVFGFLKFLGYDRDQIIDIVRNQLRS